MWSFVFMPFKHLTVTAPKFHPNLRPDTIVHAVLPKGPIKAPRKSTETKNWRKVRKLETVLYFQVNERNMLLVIINSEFLYRVAQQLWCLILMIFSPTLSPSLSSSFSIYVCVCVCVCVCVRARA